VSPLSLSMGLEGMIGCGCSGGPVKQIREVRGGIILLVQRVLLPKPPLIARHVPV
jgi:hypothetical protein